MFTGEKSREKFNKTVRNHRLPRKDLKAKEYFRKIMEQHESDKSQPLINSSNAAKRYQITDIKFANGNKKNLLNEENQNAKKKKVKEEPWKLIVIAILSMITFIVLWFTGAYNTLMIQPVILRNNSIMLSWWLKPPVDLMVKVHVFNYTNIDRFLNGSDDKIKIKETGPYVFRDDVEKVKLEFHDDSISFYENRTHVFDSSLSGKNLTVDDVINVPNMGFISAIVNVKEMGMFAEIGLRTAISVTKPQEFQNLTIKDFLFGRADEFMNLISKVRWDIDPKDVCMLGYRDGLSKRKFTVKRGIIDIGGLGQFSKIDDKPKDTMWTTDECNKIHGSDLALYNSTAVKNQDILFIFPPEIHRGLPISFIEKRTVYSIIPSYYYQGNTDVFDLNNTYYCQPKTLKVPHIDGTVALSDTLRGNPPIYGSFAHFYKADPKLFEPFDGLKPDPNLHTPHAYIQPRLGMIMKGSLIWQLNIKVTAFKNHYKKFDGLILPLAWMEFTVDELPLRFKIMLFMMSPVCDILEVILKYGSILSFIYSLFYLVRIFKESRRVKIKFDS